MKQNPTITDLIPQFLDYMKVERRFSEKTITKYHENIRWFVREIGNMRIVDIQLQDFMSLKATMFKNGAKESRISGVIYTLKCLLLYAQDILQLGVLDLKKVKGPQPPKREVIYLSDDEVSQLIGAIQLETPWTRRPYIAGYCSRALVETLLCTAMRISEALSLNRDSIDFEHREVTIIGKGDKQRKVFFTPRALEWINKYLNVRTDSAQALFATSTGRRLKVDAAESRFRRISKKAAIGKPVRPHILRHTAATNLLRRGCPIGYIKEILGHTRLETTCQYYLGVLDHAETKKAFDSYMVYEPHAEAYPEPPRPNENGSETAPIGLRPL